MHRIRLLFILFITLLAIPSIGMAESDMQLREPDSTFLENYIQEKDFNYSGTYTSDVRNIWLLDQIEKILSKLDPIVKYYKEIHIAFKIIIATLFLYLLYIIFKKTKLYKLFYSQKEIEDIPFAEEELIEDSSNIEEVIAEAVSKKQYRKAIRYNYLNVIKILDQKDIIEYKKEKTNRDYRFEIKDIELRKSFANITLIYNNIWYGLKDIDTDKYQTLASDFNTFIIQVND